MLNIEKHRDEIIELFNLTGELDYAIWQVRCAHTNCEGESDLDIIPIERIMEWALTESEEEQC